MWDSGVDNLRDSPFSIITITNTIVFAENKMLTSREDLVELHIADNWNNK